MMKIETKTLKLFRGIAKLAAPPPQLKVSEWADLYRRLSSESSAEPGQWRTDRAPYQREILNAVNESNVEVVVVKSSAQVGKTELLLNTIGYYMDYDPAPIMLVQPTLEMAQAFSKDRLAPMLRDTPALRGKVSDVKSKDSGNTMLHKTFPGGHITMVGANSPSGLASRPIRILLADEVDRYPATAGTEGDPLTLAEKRTTTFWNRKKIYVSTPTVKGVSRIEMAYENSTQEQWCLPCPNCDEYQPLEWGRIHFEDATMECKYCGLRFDEFTWKARQLEGKWIARAEHPKVRGFHLNELASPWKRWTTIIEEFQEANKQAKAGNTELLKAWVNTTLGETWEEKGEGVESDTLLKRREHYGCEVPDGVLVLTCGVDVQDNRLEYEIVGWGVEQESWGIQYGVIMGDPGQNHVWQMLDAVLEKRYERKDGQMLQIMTTCIDSGGHFTKEVYKFCKQREFKRVWAIKGQGGSGVSYIQRPKRRNDAGVWLFHIAVDVGKDTLASRLQVAFEGPGYCHFPTDPDKGYDAAYFEGLTSEQRKIRYTKGRATIHWEKRYSGARNEPFDLRNYATAAYEILNPPIDALKKQLENGRPESTKPIETSLSKKRTGVAHKGIQI
ncbi:phage terminase large subunit family protein [Brevibacillus sp. H7]|uniref:phage terminase large subunit family protein n=1 Tax=Brevibacillus sp. H7 TaxID=3349138 RepID=UPI0038260A21